MPTKDLLDTARRWWPVLLVALLLGGLVGHAVPGRSAAQYRSEVRLLVGPLSGGTDTLRASGLLAQTYAAVLTSDDVLRRAARSGGMSDRTPMEEVRKTVAVLSNDKTRVVTIEVTLESADLARRMADSLTRQVMQWVDRDVAEQQRLLDDLRRTGGPEATAGLGPPGLEGRITVVDAPRAAELPLPQPVLLYTVLVAIVSAGAALAVLLLGTGRSRRGTSPELLAVANRRLLGTCRLDGGGLLRRRRRAVVARRPASEYAVDYRLIAAKAELLAPAGPLRSLAVFGSRDATGSAEVATNLALTFAQSGRTVALLDLSPDSAVSEVLPLQDAQRQVQRIGAFVVETAVLPAGRGRVAVVLSRDPALHATPEESPAVADLLRELADMVVMHAPPLLLEPTTLVVATQVDGVAVVAAEEEGDAAVEAVADALDALERVGAPVLGAVLALGRPARSSRPAFHAHGDVHVRTRPWSGSDRSEHAPR